MTPSNLQILMTIPALTPKRAHTVLSATISRAQRLSHGFAQNAMGLYGQ